MENGLSILKLQQFKYQVTSQFYISQYNLGQNCWHTFDTLLSNRPPLPPNKVESLIFVPDHLEPPNIDWWGRGRDRGIDKA